MANWNDKASETRKGEELDIDRLKSFLLDNISNSSGSLAVRQFQGGFSNLTYLVTLGEREYVLRRSPFGANIKSGHDMSREYKILSKLNSAFHKSPSAVFYTDDESIIGSSFYVMERLNGVILRHGMPEKMQPNKELMRGIADSYLDTLMELHHVDVNEVGLGDLGKPEGYVERQISGWTKRYFNAKTEEVPKLEQAAKWLADNQPLSVGSSLIHNDFKYDNLILHPDDWTKVVAVLDWEMATLGDPLMDLGTSLGYWINYDDPDFMKQMKINSSHLPGNPKRGELLHTYSLKTKREVDDGVFYYVYGLFKIAVIIQQIYVRYKKGLTKDERFSKLIEGVHAFGLIAERAIAKKKIDDLF